MAQEERKPKPGWAKRELERVAKEVESWPPWMRVYSSAYLNGDRPYQDPWYCRRCGTKPAYRNGICARCE